MNRRYDWITFAVVLAAVILLALLIGAGLGRLLFVRLGPIFLTP
jgi:hypothetical protein